MQDGDEPQMDTDFLYLFLDGVRFKTETAYGHCSLAVFGVIPG